MHVSDETIKYYIVDFIPWSHPSSLIYDVVNATTAD